MRFSIEDFQIRRKLKKSLIENFIFYAVYPTGIYLFKVALETPNQCVKFVNNS